MIGRIYVGDYNTLLHTKYISCGPHGIRGEDFKVFSHFMSMRATVYEYLSLISSKTKDIDFLFYEIMGPPICLNSSWMPHSLVFSSLSRFW